MTFSRRDINDQYVGRHLLTPEQKLPRAERMKICRPVTDWRVVIWVAAFLIDLVIGNSVSSTRDQSRVKVTSLELEPYVMRAAGTKNSTEAPRYEGFMVDLLDKLMTSLGLDYQLSIAEDGQFGAEQAGTWNGMIGKLMRRESDMAASPMYITLLRLSVVDFSHPFLYDQATLLVKKSLSPSGDRSWIRSAQDLLSSRNKDLRIGTLSTGLIIKAFRTTNNTLHKKLWERMTAADPSAFTRSNFEGVSNVRTSSSSSPYVFVLPSTIGDYLTRKRPCDLATHDRFLMNMSFGLAFPKGSGLLQQVDRLLTELERQSYLKDLYRKWWIQKNDCSDAQGNTIRSRDAASTSSGHLFIIDTTLLFSSAIIAQYFISYNSAHFTNIFKNRL